MVKDMAAPAILDRDGGVERLGLGADVILPQDPAGLRLEGEDEAPARATPVAGEGGHDLLERAAGDDQLAVGEDRRGEEDVNRMGTGKVLGPRVQLPMLRSGRPVQRIEPAADVAEEDRVLGDERRGEDALGGGLEADIPSFLIRRPYFRLGPPLPVSRIAVRPAELAVRCQLVERRVRGRAEVDVAVHDDGRGVDDADIQV